MRSITVAIVLILAAPATALEYTCPSDPGFCYLDVADDGCFDTGTDTGPINALLEAGPFPDPLPPADGLPADPGSIVCPPSVKQLKIPDGVTADWRTAPGSDVLLFGRRISFRGIGPIDATIEIRSGGVLHLGSDIFATSFNAGDPILLRAQGDVSIGRGIRVRRSCRVPSDCHSVEIESVLGNIDVAAKAKLFGTTVHLSAPGDVTFGDKVRVVTYDGTDGFLLSANGSFETTNPRFKTGYNIVTANGILVHGLGNIRDDQIDWDAGTGDLVAERVKLNGSIELRGDSIEIGGDKKSKMRTPWRVNLLATGSVTLRNTDVKVVDRLRVVTSGLAVNLNSVRVSGSGAPTTTVETGVGSTCDFTGSDFSAAPLAHDCDTVSGP